jgi:hypothetical protein
MLHEAKIAYYAFDVISGHTELLIPSGYAAILFAKRDVTASHTLSIA